MLCSSKERKLAHAVTFATPYLPQTANLELFATNMITKLMLPLLTDDDAYRAPGISCFDHSTHTCFQSKRLMEKGCLRQSTRLNYKVV